MIQVPWLFSTKKGQQSSKFLAPLFEYVYGAIKNTQPRALSQLIGRQDVMGDSSLIEEGKRM